VKRLLLIPLLVAFALPGCGGDDDDDNGSGPDLITMADLAGDWDVTMYLATSVDDPQLQFELIAAGGSMEVLVQQSGAFAGTATFPDPDLGELVTIPFGGTLSLESQSELYADFSVEIPPLLEDGTLAFQLTGNTLQLEQDGTTFDFDNDGDFEPATFAATLVRQ
jgi:hypothetical protein